MGSNTNNPALEQGRKKRANDFKTTITKTDLKSLGLFERAKMMQLFVFLKDGPKTKMEIYHDGNFFRNGLAMDKLDELARLGYVSYSDLGKKTLVTLTKKGYELAEYFSNVFEIIQRKD